jgi:hypothetical protein
MPSRSSVASAALGITGLALLGLSALLFDASRGIFNDEAFASRVAASLGDSRVADFVAVKITDGVVAARPNLIAVRPLLEATAAGLVRSEPFRAAARASLRTAHRTLFSEGGSELLLSIPDLGILARSALAGASPDLAAKIPDNVDAVLADLPHSRIGATVVRARAAWVKLRWLQGTLLVLSPLLLLWGVLIHPDRRHGLVRLGMGLVAVGLLIALVIPAGRLVALLVSQDPATRGAIFGVWRAYFLPLLTWAVTFSGTGLVLAAAGNSLHEAVDPFRQIPRLARALTTPPERRGRRLLWILGTAAASAVLLVWPSSVVTVLAVVGGLLLAFAALRELFRLALENVPETSSANGVAGRHRWPLRAGVGVVMAAALIGAIVYWRRPTEPPVEVGEVLSCNGSPALCDRPINRVVFPASHNSMSNAEIKGWMFPHHSHDMPGQLQDGMRALLFDIHYGFPGGERIKTDLQGEGATREKLVGAVGEEGFAAAERIRDRLVGVDEGRRGLYFCHGFCELGAYPVVPALAAIRDWLVVNPSEVVMIVIEDYVTPEEMAAAFQESGLMEFVYTGPIDPLPTMRQMIDAGGRVLVFLESGKPGVPWMHPAFTSIQETPYSFHTPEEFSCKPNRGGTTPPMFQINHWIETTPAPKPSNAEIVNAYDFLLKRALTCQRERRHLPNVIAVDFEDIGDLVRVAHTLNGLDSTATKPR